MIVNAAVRAAAFDRGVLSREIAEFGECPVEVVGDAPAEQPPEHLVTCGGEAADSPDFYHRCRIGRFLAL